MGVSCSRPSRCSRALQVSNQDGAPVTLHVYNLEISNDSVYHCGVEIFGWEWSYGAKSTSALPHIGIFCCWPGDCEGYSLRESIPMGNTSLSEEDILSVITVLERKWPSADSTNFDVLKRSSVDFCDEFCKMLDVTHVPSWVKVSKDGAISGTKTGKAASVPSKELRPRPVAKLGMWKDTNNTEQIPAKVTLHVYNLGTYGGCQVLNGILRPLGMGFFHCGIEIYSWEWSFSDTSRLPNPLTTGVFCCRPRGCEGHTYDVSVQLGTIKTPEREVLRLIALLEKKWPGNSYDIFTRNCGHFCDELSRTLGVGPIPEWVTRAAKMGEQVALKTQKHSCAQMCCWSDTGARPSQLEEINFVRAVPVIQQSEIEVEQ